MSGQGTFTKLLVVVVFGAAIAVIGAHELKNNYLAKYKDKPSSADPKQMGVMLGNDIDVAKASFNADTAKEISDKNSKQDSRTEIKNLLQKLVP